jgi:predicted ATPase
MLDYKKDYARVESSIEALNLEKALEKSYQDLGIEVIRVPKMSIDERVNFVLANL